LGGGFYISLETFRRFETMHTNAGMSWRVGKSFMLSLGVTELNRFLFKDGAFGLHFGGHQPTATGYETPGYYLSLSFSRSLTAGERFNVEDEIRDQNTRIAQLEIQVKALSDSIRHNIKSYDSGLRKSDASMKAQISRSAASLNVAKELRDIVDLLSSDLAYDPAEIGKRKTRIVKMGKQALPALKSTALDKTADTRIRAAATGLLGDMKAVKDNYLVEILVSLLSEPVLDIRIEALLALGKLKDPGTIAEIEPLVNDPDEAIAITAKEILSQIKASSSQ